MIEIRLKSWIVEVQSFGCKWHILQPTFFSVLYFQSRFSWFSIFFVTFYFLPQLSVCHFEFPVLILGCYFILIVECNSMTGWSFPIRWSATILCLRGFVQTEREKVNSQSALGTFSDSMTWNSQAIPTNYSTTSRFVGAIKSRQTWYNGRNAIVLLMSWLTQ